MIEALTTFHLRKSEIMAPGGGKSPISSFFERALHRYGWVEKRFDTEIVIDGKSRENPTHKIDLYKNQIALEIEWNNKDPFYDRDLNNFRILHELGIISVGIMITRSDELQDIFDRLGKGASYGPSTTHMSKLLPRIDGGGAGGSPILIFGITKKLYVSH